MVAEKYEGKVFSTKNHGELVVLEYDKYSKVLIKFLKTGYETVTTMGSIKNGLVKDKLIPLKVTGGFLGLVEVKDSDGRYLTEYRDWETDRKSTRLNSSHSAKSRMPSSA